MYKSSIFVGCCVRGHVSRDDRIVFRSESRLSSFVIRSSLRPTAGNEIVLSTVPLLLPLRWRLPSLLLLSSICFGLCCWCLIFLLSEDAEPYLWASFRVLICLLFCLKSFFYCSFGIGYLCWVRSSVRTWKVAIGCEEKTRSVCLIVRSL